MVFIKITKIKGTFRVLCKNTDENTKFSNIISAIIHFFSIKYTILKPHIRAVIYRKKN